DVRDGEALADALPEILRRHGAVDLRQRRRLGGFEAVALEGRCRRGGRRGRGDDGRGRLLGRDRRYRRRGRPGLRRGRRNASLENERQREEGGESQNLFFHSRIAAKTRTGSATRAPRYLFADSITAGSRQRRNGLVAFSSPSRLGSV